jgi:general secretion pathway protein D
VVLGLALALAAGCATGRALRNADVAGKAGDWDAAVAYYREAAGRDPGRIDIKLALERATRMASALHLDRARDLEAQQQTAGAIAEYRLAADLDPSNTLALTKVLELERRMREQAEAMRQPTGIEALRQQAAAAASPVPHLDPRRIVGVFFRGSVRDALDTIRDLTNINITYDQQLDSFLSRAYELNIQDMTVESVLNQVLSANQLTFKVIDQNTIFIYQDIPAKRQQWDDVYVQTFYVSHADANELVQLLNQMVTQGAVVRPQITPNKNLNSIQVKATFPVLQAIEAIIRSNDKPRAEVIVEAEILEVDRVRMRQLGIDLNQYALGLTFSPELAPPNEPGVLPPTTPPPFNLNTISRGVNTTDFYLTPLTAVVNFLESDSTTKVLARSSLRGREGTQMALRLGDSIPIPTSTFQSQAGGGFATVPVQQVTYQSVGINLLFTPRVTFEGEIILDTLTVEKSGLGAFIDIAGQSLPTITIRRADSAMRLRDGEPNMLAGLLRDEERNALRGLPWFSRVPLLRSLLGSSNNSTDQTDVVMIITPRIVRSQELTTSDLQPTYVGTFQNFGLGRAPQLISPNAPPTSTGGGGVAPPPAGGATLPPAGPPPPAGQTPPATTRAPGVVPIQAVGEPAAPAGPGQIAVTVGGEQQAGGIFTVPLTISNVSDVSTVSVTITYDPSILQAASVSQGTFMAQGGVTPTFAPKIDAAAGRIDIAVTRTGSGASGQGLLAGIQFMAISPGTAQLAVTGIVTSTTGQPVNVQTVPAAVIVK